jgi:hypothetical protein
MASSGEAAGDLSSVLAEILSSVKALQKDHTQLSSAVDAINGRVNILAGMKQVHDVASESPTAEKAPGGDGEDASKASQANGEADPSATLPDKYEAPPAAAEAPPRRTSTSSKIILTSYPGQSGVDPTVMNWGHKDPNVRGPVVVSRHQTTIRKRNGKLVLRGVVRVSLTRCACSNRRAWRLVCHLSCPGCGQQEPRHWTQARLYEHRTSRKHRALPGME